MTRRLRFCLIATVLVQYAFTVLLGQSLHALTGCEHHAHEEDACYACHGEQVVAGEEGHHDADSCPICHFHSLAQWTGCVDAPAWQDLPSHELSVEIDNALSASSLCPYSSRAPPCV